MTADRVRLRNLAISVFVIIWIAVFQYETLRLNYLSPLAGRMLPKVKFLYPPAGWIMFFQVDRLYGFAEVYGLHGRSARNIRCHHAATHREGAWHFSVMDSDTRCGA